MLSISVVMQTFVQIRNSQPIWFDLSFPFSALPRPKDGSSCFTVGECQDSFNFEVRQVSDKLECLDLCRQSLGCSWFTFSARTCSCTLFKDCNILDLESCPECLTGHDNCHSDNPVCFAQAQCEGIQKSSAITPSAWDCHLVVKSPNYSAQKP